MNYSYYSKHYFDDRYLDDIDDARDNSPLNENADLVAPAYFASCTTLQKLRILSQYSTDAEYGATRKTDGAVDNVLRCQNIDEDWYGFESLFGDGW